MAREARQDLDHTRTHLTQEVMPPPMERSLAPVRAWVLAQGPAPAPDSGGLTLLLLGVLEYHHTHAPLLTTTLVTTAGLVPTRLRSHGQLVLAILTRRVLPYHHTFLWTTAPRLAMALGGYLLTRLSLSMDRQSQARRLTRSSAPVAVSMSLELALLLLPPLRTIRQSQVYCTRSQPAAAFTRTPHRHHVPTRMARLLRLLLPLLLRPLLPQVLVIPAKLSHSLPRS